MPDELCHVVDFPIERESVAGSQAAGVKFVIGEVKPQRYRPPGESGLTKSSADFAAHGIDDSKDVIFIAGVPADREDILCRHPGDCHSGIESIIAGYINERFVNAEQSLLERLKTVTVETMSQEIQRRICGSQQSLTKPG